MQISSQLSSFLSQALQNPMQPAREKGTHVQTSTQTHSATGKIVDANQDVRNKLFRAIESKQHLIQPEENQIPDNTGVAVSTLLNQVGETANQFLLYDRNTQTTTPTPSRGKALGNYVDMTA